MGWNPFRSGPARPEGVRLVLGDTEIDMTSALQYRGRAGSEHVWVLPLDEAEIEMLNLGLTHLVVRTLPGRTRLGLINAEVSDMTAPT